MGTSLVFVMGSFLPGKSRAMFIFSSGCLKACRGRGPAFISYHAVYSVCCFCRCRHSSCDCCLHIIRSKLATRFLHGTDCLSISSPFYVERVRFMWDRRVSMCCCLAWIWELIHKFNFPCTRKAHGFLACTWEIRNKFPTYTYVVFSFQIWVRRYLLVVTQASPWPDSSFFWGP